jgi:hypothetical protein
MEPESSTSSEDLAKCGLCGSSDIWTETDVGWDVYEGGEEVQHMDHCRKCGAWRFNFDRFDIGTTGPTKCYGSWHKGDGDGGF